MITCSKFAEVISNYPNFLKVQTTIRQNKIKIHRILLVWERFVGSAFFELIFTPGIWCGGSNTPGISCPNYFGFLNNLVTY